MSDTLVQNVDFMDINRNSIVIRALESITKKGINPGKVFYDLQTDAVSLPDIIKFIGEDNAAASLKSFLRSFCLSAASHKTVRDGNGVIDKVALKQLLEQMEIVRMTKSKLQEEVQSISGALAELCMKVRTPEEENLMRQKAERCRRLMALLQEIEERAEARKADGDEDETTI